MSDRFDVVIGPDGQKRWVRSEAEKARRKAAAQAAKVFKDKTCEWCGQTYTPKFQYGTKRWDSSRFCCRQCVQTWMNRRPDYKAKKNELRRGNSGLHRHEYERRLKLHGGTRWRVGTPEFREQMRARNRERWARKYGSDPAYTQERRANAAHQRGRRAKAAKLELLGPDQIAECKRIRLEAQALAEQLGIKVHVDHLRPLRRGGAEHPDNLLPMTAAANLFWGDRIKRCPWPKPDVWDEPRWELEPYAQRHSPAATAAMSD